MIIDRIKLLLGTTDNEEDVELLEEIVEITKSKILSYIKLSEIPKELEFVLVELAIKRFNRIGSEGFSSESVDGKSMSYEASEFEGYEKYLDNYILRNGTKKKFRLI